ncbi:MAG: hypothetical protein AAFZ07_20245 [Actinomycetota bacterium]
MAEDGYYLSPEDFGRTQRAVVDWERRGRGGPPPRFGGGSRRGTRTRRLAKTTQAIAAGSTGTFEFWVGENGSETSTGVTRTGHARVELSSGDWCEPVPRGGGWDLVPIGGGGGGGTTISDDRLRHMAGNHVASISQGVVDYSCVIGSGAALQFYQSNFGNRVDIGTTGQAYVASSGTGISGLTKFSTPTLTQLWWASSAGLTHAAFGSTYVYGASGSRVYQFNASTGALIGNVSIGTGIVGLAADSSDNFYVLDDDSPRSVFRYDSAGLLDWTSDDNITFSAVTGASRVLSGSGSSLYVAHSTGWREIDISDGSTNDTTTGATCTTQSLVSDGSNVYLAGTSSGDLRIAKYTTGGTQTYDEVVESGVTGNAIDLDLSGGNLLLALRQAIAAGTDGDVLRQVYELDESDGSIDRVRHYGHSVLAGCRYMAGASGFIASGRAQQ